MHSRCELAGEHRSRSAVAGSAVVEPERDHALEVRERRQPGNRAPDGRRIVFDCGGSTAGAISAWSTSDGTGEHRAGDRVLSVTGEASAWGPAGDAWSPDGRAIAYLDVTRGARRADDARRQRPAIGIGGDRVCWIFVVRLSHGRRTAESSSGGRRQHRRRERDGTGCRQNPSARRADRVAHGRQLMFVSYERRALVSQRASAGNLRQGVAVDARARRCRSAGSGRWVIYARFDGGERNDHGDRRSARRTSGGT